MSMIRSNEIYCEGRMGCNPKIMVDRQTQSLSAEFSIYVTKSGEDTDKKIRHDVKVMEHSLADWARINIRKGVRVGVAGELDYEYYKASGKNLRKAFIRVNKPYGVSLLD